MIQKSISASITYKTLAQTVCNRGVQSYPKRPSTAAGFHFHRDRNEMKDWNESLLSRWLCAYKIGHPWATITGLLVSLLSVKNRNNCWNATGYSMWILSLSSDPSWPQCIHLLLVTFSMIKHHLTKQKSSQTSLTNNNRELKLFIRQMWIQWINPLGFGRTRDSQHEQ